MVTCKNIYTILCSRFSDLYYFILQMDASQVGSRSVAIVTILPILQELTSQPLKLRAKLWAPT